MNINVQKHEQTTTLLARACVKTRMGDFMLGNSKMKLQDINYVRTWWSNCYDALLHTN